MHCAGALLLGRGYNRWMAKKAVVQIALRVYNY